MAAVLPGLAAPAARQGAQKCVPLARLPGGAGFHRGFTCATIRGWKASPWRTRRRSAARERRVVDARRLGRLDARVSVAVDSPATIRAAARRRARVLIDVNVGLPRCGCARRPTPGPRRPRPQVRPRRARRDGLKDTSSGSTARCASPRPVSRWRLRAAHRDVGGDIVSRRRHRHLRRVKHVGDRDPGGIVRAHGHRVRRLWLPFRQALSVLATIVSVSPGFAVADCGLKAALGMDHGIPRSIGTKVWFCSDEHVTFGAGDDVLVAVEGEAPGRPPALAAICVGEPDPRVAGARRSDHGLPRAGAFVVSGTQVVDTWPIELRGW